MDADRLKRLAPHHPLKVPSDPPAIRMGDLQVPDAALADPNFWVCVDEAISKPQFLEELDRLVGTSFAKRLAPIEVAIDKVTGKEPADAIKLLVAVWRLVYVPLMGQTAGV